LRHVRVADMTYAVRAHGLLRNACPVAGPLNLDRGKPNGR
jgi:hypothetical protein